MNSLLRRYKRNFIHPYITLLKTFLKLQSFNLKTRDGREYKIRNGNEIYLLSLNGMNNVDLYLRGETVILNFLGRTLMFDGALEDGKKREMK